MRQWSLRSFAQARPSWSFIGIDPSQPMLNVAQHLLGPLGSRVQWVNGFIEDAPPSPCDAATCFLTLHFLPREERLHVLEELRSRLKPGAPLIVAHHSDVQPGHTETWLARSVAFAAGESADTAKAAASASGMARALNLVSPAEEEQLLREAGFADPALFYAGLSFRGWIAYAGGARAVEPL